MPHESRSASSTWLALGVTMTLAAPGCHPDPAASGPADSGVPASSSHAVPDEPTAARDAEAPSPSKPALAPLLDAAKGQKALADYRALHREAAEPKVSGSLVQAGADEVLLEGPSGRDWAGGDRALLLMRHDGTKYALVETLLVGKGWKPVARVTLPAAHDVVMLCEEGGHMGLYPGTCGFLGEGSFRKGSPAPAPSPSGLGEIMTVFVTTCGPASSVALGPITLKDDCLHAELVVEDFVLERNPDDGGGDFCSRRTKTQRKSFDLEYRFDGTKPERVTPTPKEAEAVLRRYG